MERPKENTLPVGIDSDIISYRCAWSAEGGDKTEAKNKVDEVVDNIVFQLCGDFPDLDNIQHYLTGKGNFRYSIAKTHGYKENRSVTKKPEHIGYIRDYIVDYYGAVVVEGKEADDELATQANSHGYRYIIASTDKDFMQVPCWIYNWGRGLWYKPSDYEANLAFYSQVLTGDRIDNIIGLNRVGPVTASKMLEGAKTETDMWEVCLKAYDNDYDRVVENARLLYLQRRDNELWQPPSGLVFEDKDWNK